MARAAKGYNLRMLSVSKTKFDTTSNDEKRSSAIQVGKTAEKGIKTKGKRSKCSTQNNAFEPEVTKAPKKRSLRARKSEKKEKYVAYDRSKPNFNTTSDSDKRKDVIQIGEIADTKDIKAEVRKTKRPAQNTVPPVSEITKKEVEKTSRKRRLTKIKSEASVGCEKYVGAHVSIAGGLHTAITNAVAIGAKSFGLFLRSQRQWASKPLASEAADLFRQACKDYDFSPHLIVPHGSYLLNCGSPDEETLKKSRDALTDELKRCEMLGLVLFNFHPGSTCGKITVEECLDKIGESINMAHAETKYVITVIENMSKQGHTVGGDFRELRGIIDRVKDKSRIGICLDTCHAFAAGYNLATEEGFNEMMTDFENIIGLKYLKALHINDSVGKVGCHLDRHENIGKGHIGLKGFKFVMNEPRFNNLPMILETPANIDDSAEIEKLYKLCA